MSNQSKFTAVYHDGQKFVIAYYTSTDNQELRKFIKKTFPKADIYAIFSGHCKPLESTDATAEPK